MKGQRGATYILGMRSPIFSRKKKGLLERAAKTSHISHNFLPDPVISDNTVEDVPESPSRPTEEPLMTVHLGSDIEEHQKARAAKKEVEQRGGEYVDSDEEEGDEEEEDDTEEGG